MHAGHQPVETFTMSEEGCLINYLYTAIELYLRTLTTLSTSNVVWSVVNNSKCECSLTAKTRLPPGVQWQTQHISLCPVTVGWIQKDIKYGQQRPILQVFYSQHLIFDMTVSIYRLPRLVPVSYGTFPNRMRKLVKCLRTHDHWLFVKYVKCRVYGKFVCSGHSYIMCLKVCRESLFMFQTEG